MEFDDHPDRRTVYTFILETHRKNIIPSLNGVIPKFDVYTVHNVNITVNAMIGLSI